MEIVAYKPEHQGAFRALNLAWITAHWEPEPADFKMLDHPQENIIEPGGYIAVAVEGEVVLGTCALIKLDDQTCELAKMAVAEAVKGNGIGWLLGLAVIERARVLGASRVYLESNTLLTPAMNLYRKLGFKPIAGQPSPYQRCNIQMELQLVAAP